MDLKVRNAAEDELALFSSILLEGALWLANEGIQMWSMRQISIEKLLENNSLNELYIGFLNSEAVAVMILQEEDALLWSEDTKHESLYLHKLCVRRKYAKTGLSQEMIEWAKSHAKHLQKKYIKLDCAADRPKLCEFYAKQGFHKVNEKVLHGKYPTAFFEYPVD